MHVLFAAQELLYDAGARNFIFFNVPPTYRAPAGKSMFLRYLMAGRGSSTVRSRIALWNVELEKLVDDFRETHPGVHAVVYDAAAIFNSVLDNPTKYGFKDSISSGEGKHYIWLDHLHPNYPLQRILAADLARFLTNIESETTAEAETTYATS